MSLSPMSLVNPISEIRKSPPSYPMRGLASPSLTRSEPRGVFRQLKMAIKQLAKRKFARVATIGAMNLVRCPTWQCLR
jgi:hypothetical protein